MKAILLGLLTIFTCTMANATDNRNALALAQVAELEAQAARLESYPLFDCRTLTSFPQNKVKHDEAAELRKTAADLRKSIETTMAVERITTACLEHSKNFQRSTKRMKKLTNQLVKSHEKLLESNQEKEKPRRKAKRAND